MTKLYKFPEMKDGKPLFDSLCSWECDLCGKVQDRPMLQVGKNKHYCSPKCTKSGIQTLLSNFFKE